MASPDAVDICRDCIARLDEALRLPPAQLGAEVDIAEREVVRLRDLLIHRLRHGDLPSRDALDKVNATLSLIVGVEYPAGGIHRTLLEQARNTLRQLLEQVADPTPLP